MARGVAGPRTGPSLAKSLYQRSLIATYGTLLRVLAGLVPAIRRGAVPPLMAGTMAGHDGVGRGTMGHDLLQVGATPQQR